MSEILNPFPRWCANYINGKVGELAYQLKNVVDLCEQSMAIYQTKQQLPSEKIDELVYAFSAFSNVIQTLKDSTTTITGRQVPWSEIAGLRHGEFLRNARNAATHDGNPILDAWIDGKHYTSSTISRVNQRGEIIEIAPPSTDIKTVCLEFSEDFGILLENKLAPIASDYNNSLSMIDIEDIHSRFQENPLVPEFAKELFTAKREEITAALTAAEHNPVQAAVETLHELIRFARSKQ